MELRSRFEVKVDTTGVEQVEPRRMETMSLREIGEDLRRSLGSNALREIAERISGSRDIGEAIQAQRD